MAHGGTGGRGAHYDLLGELMDKALGCNGHCPWYSAAWWVLPMWYLGMVGATHVVQRGMVGATHVAQRGMVGATRVVQRGMVGAIRVVQRGMVGCNYSLGEVADAVLSCEAAHMD